MEKITFVTDDGGKEEFYVEEQTRINGVNYILVSDSKDDEANAYILKDISTDTAKSLIVTSAMIGGLTRLLSEKLILLDGKTVDECDISLKNDI